MKSPLSLVWGVIAFVIYFSILGLLLVYFNTRNTEKPKHFVKKNHSVQKKTTSISVSLSLLKPIKEVKKKPKVIPPKPKVEEAKEVVVNKAKPIAKKVSTKKIIKEKIVKKIKKKKVTKKEIIKKLVKKKELKKKKIVKKAIKKKPIKVPKPKKSTDLFANINTKKETKQQHVKKNNIKITDKPTSAMNKINNTNAKKSNNKGKENAYFAKVQSLLETWPAQSDYAGEKAMVTIYVKPTGIFEFKVKSQSDNVDFNLGLIDFLMQLQRMGLGKHDAGKTYEFEVEFIAKE
jgi:hypothetical protein